MEKRTGEHQQDISFLRDLKDILPFEWDGTREWSYQVIRRDPNACRSYISPNRRDFYKILYMTKGVCVLTLGLKSYYVDKPAIFFIHPGEILTFRKMDEESEGFICFFKRKIVDNSQGLRSIQDKYALFSDSQKSAIFLSEADIAELDPLFEKMLVIGEKHGGQLEEELLQIHLQLLIVTCTKIARYLQPDTISDEHRHIHDFFHLLETEVSNITYNNPIQVRTAQEFSGKLFVHPNHLNALLKKHTGKNVSTHIKNRILEESKALLVQTDWSIQQIAYSVGFADQPNFSQFFKKLTGTSPGEFRKNYVKLDA